MTRKRRRAFGNVDYQDPFGNTLLHGAVVSGDAEEVARLLAAGADAGIANRDGRTALHAAEIFGHAEIQALLARRGGTGSLITDRPLRVANVTSHQQYDTFRKPRRPRIAE
jgi:ankyrin repeat protein